MEQCPAPLAWGRTGMARPAYVRPCRASVLPSPARYPPPATLFFLAIPVFPDAKLYTRFRVWNGQTRRGYTKVDRSHPLSVGLKNMAPFA
jgi:hypothetical protein